MRKTSLRADRHPKHWAEAKALAALYEVRRESYALADIHVPITGDDPAVAVEAILRHPLLK